VLCLLVVASCGRLGFDASRQLDPDAVADARFDVKPDVPDGTLTQTLTVANALDEGEIDQGAWYPDGEDVGAVDTLFIGYYPNNWTWAYFRLVIATTIPPGATIVDGRLHLWGRGTTSIPAGSRALLAFGELAQDPAAVTTINDRPTGTTGRPLTQASVRWPETGGIEWATDAWNDSTNLAPVIAELAGSTGRAAGTHIQLWIRGESAVAGEVGSDSFDVPGSHHATLEIAWTEP
jgi:hypothetical protein